jgi:hypothetical protein
MRSLTCPLALTMLICGMGAHGAAAQQRMIYDDDCSQDVDCVVTLPILHRLADRGEVQILAMVADSANPLTAPVFHLFAQRAGHEGIAIGANPGKQPANALCEKNKCNDSDWTEKLVARFDAGDTRSRYPDCVTVYRKALAGAPDGSVAIVATGFATCLNRLLDSGVDAISAMDGAALVKRKVKLLSIMGGRYPSGLEWNFESDAPSYHALFARWTRQRGFPPVYLNGFANGEHVMAGAPANVLSTEDPTKCGLELCGVDQRPMWDMLSVLFATRGTSYRGTAYFTQSAPGTVAVDAATGSDTWSKEIDSGHYVLTNAATDATFSELLKDLLPTAAQNTRGDNPIRTPPLHYRLF